MTQKDFIKLEAKILLEVLGDDKDLLVDLIEHGLADELRAYAQFLNYDISESELKRIVISKLFSRYLYD